MNSNTFIITKNVNNANIYLQKLIDRPKSDVPGLAVFFGKPGLGKTTWAQNLAFNNNNVFFHRLKAAETTKGFLVRILANLRSQNSFSERGSIQSLYEDIEQILLNNPDYIILIDEADRAFGRNYRVLDIIRDLADCTLATIVLIGMDSLKDKIKKFSQYYFDRCYFFYEFDVVDVPETKSLISQKLNIKATDAIADSAWKKSHGTLRKTIKVISEIEDALNSPENDSQ